MGVEMSVGVEEVGNYSEDHVGVSCSVGLQQHSYANNDGPILAVVVRTDCN